MPDTWHQSFFVHLNECTPENAQTILHAYTGWNQSIAAAAYRKGYHVGLNTNEGILQIIDPHTKKIQYFYSMHTPLNSHSVASISNNKFVTSRILQDGGIPVARSIRLYKEQFLKENSASFDLRFPVVVKPNTGTFGGDGVVVNISTEKELHAVLQMSFQMFPSVIVEEFHVYPKEYRVLILDGKLIAATQRIAAYIIGDGVLSVRQLIDEKNRDRGSNPHMKVKSIPLDEVTVQHITDAGYTQQSIVSAGEIIQLQDVVNAGRGGEFYDVTDDVCAETAATLLEATRLLGLRFVGFDVLCNDISKPLQDETGIIVESNEYPGITCHLFPHKGKPRRVDEAIVDALFV